MIISRTPLRISLGGGGTDLPSYYREFGGFVISAAINRYVFLALNRTFTNDYFLKYAAMERVGTIDEIEHPIVREALRLHPIEPGIELVSVADIPSGTGLGSSGAFGVGLLRAILAFQREHATPANLAEEACSIEIERLGRPVGKQDQYIAAFGGLMNMTFEKDGGVHVSPLLVSNETLRDLDEHLVMFFTGYSRDADRVLEEQRVRSEAGDSEMIEGLHFVRELGEQIGRALEAGRSEEFAALMDEHWQHKKRRSQAMSNSEIDHWYQAAMMNGALGGKLVGAGAGGFLLFYAKDRDKLRAAMKMQGLKEVHFSFDHDGSVVLVRD